MQRLSPIEIQKQVFAKSLHGFNDGEVRAYLSLVAEEFEQLMQEIERLSRDNAQMREQLLDHSERERMLKDTLLSAQKVSEDVKANAHKEASLIVKDAELLAERIVSQAMSRVGDLERLIQDLKLERKGARRRLQNLIEACQQMIDLDAEEEAGELPLTQLHKKRQDG